MSPPPAANEQPIPLRVANKKAYVWDVEDVARIRSQYRLCGILAGTLPHLSQQNIFLGIPLVLLPEEAVLLVELGAAVLIDDPSAHQNPSYKQLKRWNDEQQTSMKSQISLVKAKFAKENAGSGRALSEDAQRKRKEREERKKAKAATLGRNPEDMFQDTPSSETKAPSVPYTIVVPAASSAFGWYQPESHSYRTIDEARTAGIWGYPSNLEERARCGIFRGLWDRGYYLGVGIKFGGEYLVYPGDPLRYHSHFVATVLESPTTLLRPMEIVAHGRLGTATKKSHLLCGWDDEKEEVTYLSIEWAGFG